MNSDKAKRIIDIENYKLIIISIIGCILAVTPEILNFSIKFNSIGIILYSIELFALALKNPTKSKCKFIENIGEKLSLYIYIFHCLIDVVIEHLLRTMLNTTTNNIYLWCRPIIVLILSVITSWIFYLFFSWCKRKINKNIIA